MTELALLDSFGYFVQGLVAVFQPTTFIYLCVGLFMGFWVGILPGVGGPTTLALLFPFTFTLDPFAAFALLLGMISVTSTAGDLTAILFGVPGESTNAAIMIDGLPLAKGGEAGRALGAALVSSLLGAIIGAFFLAVGIVLVRPLVLSVGYAEFFMLSLAGIAFLASLSANAVFKGLAAGALGLLLSTVGLSQMTGIQRFTFGSLFLWDGIGFIPAILGLFAIPELIDMATGQSRLTAATNGLIGNSRQGARDAFRHIGLIFRCSALATYIGLIPGMGASIAQWVAYGHAAQTAKEQDKIGKGAIEGVIGPGAACTATQSGSLIPTIGFGVPGSPQMAILLGAFIVQGLVPGPSMLTPEADGGHLILTFSMVWMIIVANIIVVAASFLFLNQIAKVAYLDEHLLIPFILVLLFIGGFANKNDLNDLWVCLLFGLLGWAMERHGWPRPPLILGLVLGALIETNLFLTLQAYGMSWVSFPGVVLIFILIVGSIAWPFLKLLWNRRRTPWGAPPVQEPSIRPQPDATAGQATGGGATTVDVMLVVLFGAVFLYAALVSYTWSFSAGLMPLAVSITGLLIVAVQGWATLRHFIGREGKSALGEGIRMTPDLRAGIFVWSIYLGFFALVYLAGFVYAAGAFLFFYLMRYSGLGGVRSAALGAASSAAVYFGFQRLLELPLPDERLVEALAPWLDLALR